MPDPTPTARQLQVLAGLARGHDRNQIADRTHMTAATVKNTMDALRAKHGVHTSEELVHLGYTRGWLAGLAPEPRPHIALSDRQLEVLHHMTAGLTNDQIATRLRISVSTVVEYARRLRDHLDARNRPHLVALGHQHGHLTTHPKAAAA